MVKDKNFYKSLLLVGLPVAFQSLVSLGVIFLDNIMVGRIPAAGGFNTQLAIAAVAQANIITTLFAFFIKGLSGGASLMISQYWGKGDKARIKSVFSIILIIGFSVASAAVLAVFFFPQSVMKIVTNDPAIIREGAKYIKIVCLMYVFYTLTETLIAMLRCVEIVSVTLYISCSSLFVNLFFNYALIYGKFGLPELGIEGAAIATVITKTIEFIIVCAFTFFIQKRIDYKLSDLFRIEKVMWKDYVKYGLPVIVGDMQWGLVGVLRGIIIGRLGEQMISANNIAEIIMQLASIFTTGLGAAACVIVGKTVGEKDYVKTRQYSNTLQVLFASFGFLMCTILFFLRGSLVAMYNIPPDTAAYAKTFIGIGSFTLLGTFYHATCFTGINRGAGDSKFVFKVDMVCGWLVVLPVTYLNAFIFKAPLPIIFLSTKIDQCFKWFIAFLRLLGNKWIKNVTRE